MWYDLTRSRRKTIGVYIKDGRVFVRAPQRVSRREIDSFVASKRAWIEARLPMQLEALERRGAFRLDYGSAVLYLGRERKIAAADESEDINLPAGLDEKRLKQALIKFYRERANEIISERLKHFAPLMGVRPGGFRVGAAKRSWGRCSAAGKLTFSWRLVMADIDALDYVVVHELAHLKELNHSRRF